MTRPLGIGVLLALAGATPSIATAQVEVAVRGGVNITTMAIEVRGQPADGPRGLAGALEAGQERFGTTFGAAVGIQVSSALGVELGVMRAQYGFQDSREMDALEARVEFDYVDIPIVLTLRPPPGRSPLRPRLFAGGLLGIETKCMASLQGVIPGALGFPDTEVSQQGSCDDPVFENPVRIKTLGLGLLFGAGFEVRLPATALAVLVDAVYALGLSDVVEEPTIRARHRGLRVGAGLLVPLAQLR